MSKSPEDLGIKGSVITVNTQIKDTINDLLKKAMDKGIFDAVLIPMRAPAGDSFVYVLIKDKSLLKDAWPLPPIMSVQGANAVTSITRLGKGNMKIAAVMRPCEIRATIELAKIDQAHIENFTLISMDCPGVMPSLELIKNPEQAMKRFDSAVASWDDTIMRPVCQICDKSSMIAGDLHIGILGAKKDTLFIISRSQKGKEILDKLGIKSGDTIDSWQTKVKQHTEKKREKRQKTHATLKTQMGGLDNFLEQFSQCINCHNCMSVCPVCYCRLCYFDSDKMQHPSAEYLQRAQSKGCIRFLPDTTLFHMGRMTHMSLSCVSCGSCEDACPVSIPVAQIFSMIADQTQGVFDYVAGRSIEEPLPLKTYQEDELHEVEDAHD